MNNEVTDDQKLLDTLRGNGEEESKPSKEKKKSKKKEEIVVTEPEQKSPEKKVETTGELDPKTEFVKLLTGVGIKKEKAEIVADVFYRGSIDDPEWLDKALILGDLGMKHRELVITSYYGATPQELGIELLPQSKLKQHQSQKIGQEADLYQDIDLQKIQADALRRKFKFLQDKQLLKEITKMEEETRDKEKPVAPKKVITRPLIDLNKGEIIMKDGQPVMERIIIEGESNTSSYGNDGMMPVLTTLLVKMLDNKTPSVPPTDPNAKPVWALDLEKKLELQKADEDKRRLEDEVKREKEKREAIEKEFKEKLDDVDKQHQKDIDRAREDTATQIKNLSDRWEDDKRHREELDGIMTTYGTRMEDLKRELDTTRKDIKSVVAQEGVKTASSVIKSVTTTGEEIVKPLAETLTEGFKLQLDTMRKGAGLTKEVPETTEEELKNLV